MSYKYAVAEATKACLVAFNLCLEAMSTTTWLDDQLDRFNLWAANSYILADYSSHASMDWRLRDRQDLVDMMLQLLKPLENYLSLIYQYTVSGTGDQILEPPSSLPSTSSSSSSSSDPASEEEPECQTVLETVKGYVEETISELFRLSAAIRSAGINNRYAKSANFVEYSKDGVNLTLKFKEAVSNQLYSILLVAEDYMRERLVESISLRQRGLAFTQKQKFGRARGLAKPKVAGKSSQSPLPSRTQSAYGRQSTAAQSKPSSSSGNASQLPKRAPQAPKPSQTTRYSATEVGSVSLLNLRSKPNIAAGEYNAIDEGLLNFPPCPKGRKIGGEIECPHCAIAMEANKLQGKSWMRHFLSDFRPYICVLSDCKTPYALFGSASLWMIHMKSEHKTSQWTCAANPHLNPETFLSEAHFLEHISSDHAGAFTSFDAAQMARFSEEEVARDLDENVLSRCPICAVTLKTLGGIDELYHHIAQELFDHALLSLKYLSELSRILQGESERFSSSEGSGKDRGPGKQRQSVLEQETLLPWSLWLTDKGIVPDSPEVEKELETYGQDLVIDPEWDFVGLQSSWTPVPDTQKYQGLANIWMKIRISKGDSNDITDGNIDSILQAFAAKFKKDDSSSSASTESLNHGIRIGEDGLSFPTKEQQLDMSGNSPYIYRPGELIWFENGSVWRLGIVGKRGLKNDQPQYLIQPLSNPLQPQPHAIKNDGTHLRNWLGWSVPKPTKPELDGLLYENVDWSSTYTTSELSAAMTTNGVVDGSILASKSIDASCYPFYRHPASTTPEEIHYSGIFIGGEKVWAGEPVRVRLDVPSDDICVFIIQRIIEHITVESESSISFVGDIFKLVNISPPRHNLILYNLLYANLPPRMVEDIRFRNEVSRIMNTPKWYKWQLMEPFARKNLADIKGRWYESRILLPVLQGPDFYKDVAKGIVKDPNQFMNSVGSNDIIPGQRRRNRMEILALAVPGDFRVSGGLDGLDADDSFPDDHGQIRIREPQLLQRSPHTIFDIYDIVFQSIDPGEEKRISSILTWLLCSHRSLYVQELAEIYILDPEREPPISDSERISDMEQFLELLPRFIMCSPPLSEWDGSLAVGERAIIEFTDPSIEEYLTSQESVDNPQNRFSITEGDAHRRICEACLTYHLWLSERELVTSEVLLKYPLWEYAAKYWMKHMDTMPRNIVSTKVTDMALRAFEAHSQSLLNTIRITRENWTLESSGLVTPLYYAAELNVVLVVELLVGHGAEVNSQGGFYGNALQAACVEKNLDVVQLLLRHGADVNAQGGYYRNALQAACLFKNLDIIQLLFKHRADVNAQGGYYGNALQAACWEGSIEVVQILIHEGANVNLQGGQYGTALIAAVSSTEWEVAKLLLSHGAEGNPPGLAWDKILEKLDSVENDRVRRFRENPTLQGIEEMEAEQLGDVLKKGKYDSEDGSECDVLSNP